MYLFEKNPTMFFDPWPHLITDECLDRKLANKLASEYNSRDYSKIWKEFIDLHISNLQPI
jgi:hypothetical protein